MDNNQGFGLIGTILALVAIMLIVVVVYSLYQQSGIDGATCHTQEGIRICAAIEDDESDYSEGYRLVAEFFNSSDSRHEATYGTTNTEPIRIVNGSPVAQDRMGVGGTAITTIGLDPQEKRVIRATFTPDMLEGGENVIKVRWMGVETSELIVERQGISQADKEVLRERCIGTQTTRVRECTFLNVTIADNAFDIISDVDEHLEREYGLLRYEMGGLPDEIDSSLVIVVPVASFESEHYQDILEADSAFEEVNVLERR